MRNPRATKRLRLLAVTTVVLGLASLAGCAGSAPAEQKTEGREVHITIGTGLPYAPLTIIKSTKVLEKAFPKDRIVWETGVSGGAATRDGLVSGKIQVGVTGIAPFLIGLDKGVPWKVLGSMGQIGISLVALDPKIKTLAELDASGRPISLPSPDSGQALALKVLAQKELGNSAAFDDQLTPMPHPDAFQALTSGTIGAAFIAPPFQYQLLDKGAHEIASAADAFGPITYSAIVVSGEFSKANPDIIAELDKALKSALAELRDQPAAAAKVLSDADGGKVPAATYEAWIKLPQNIWEVTPSGFRASGEAMKQFGLIKNVPNNAQMFLPQAQAGQ